jgi:4-hydroxy 2-oxovalerate aldolase
MEAIDCGTTWVDGTVFGMGRGAGNASTEDILLQLVSTDSQRFFPTAIFELIRKDFEPLMEKYDWGSNMFYAFAASHDIHPTYVQQMLSTDGYKVDEIMAVLKSLSDDDSKNSFCSDSLQGIVQAHYTNSVGTWSASSWVAGRPVLLLANGPSALEHKSGLLRLIERLNPLVISMNYVPWIESQYVDAYAFCHPTRLASYMDDLGVFEAPIITPLGGLSAKAQASLRNHTVFDFGLSIEDDSVDIFDVGCRLQAPMVAGYALALALAGESSQILLAGFDGYGGNVSKIADMNRCFEQLRYCAPDMRLTSVTPCPYNVQHDSLYSPRWLEPASHAFRNNHGTIDHHPRKVSV